MKSTKDTDNSESKTEAGLRCELLEVQILAFKKESQRGWLWHMGPTLGAIVASIAASIIVILFGSQVVRQYFESRVASSQQQSIELQSLISQLQIQAEGESKKLGDLNRDIRATNSELSAKRNYLGNIETVARFGLAVEIKDNGRYYTLSVETYPQGATVTVLGACSGNYVFPGSHPEPTACKIVFEPQCLEKEKTACNTETCQTSDRPCVFNYIGKVGSGMDRSVWVLAEMGGVTIARYIYLEQ